MPGDPLIPVPEENLKRFESKPGTHSNCAQDAYSRNFEEVVESTSKRALQYESQMQELSIKLAENLSNFRAVDSLVQESLDGLKRDIQRAHHALHEHIPRIHEELHSSLASLKKLSDNLPETRTRVADIRQIYNSGRDTAKHLVTDLEWLNTEWHERWRITIFTNHSPVSWRWKAIMRILFAVTFITFAWIVWAAIAGVYRAHRHRLVWGERLMS